MDGVLEWLGQSVACGIRLWHIILAAVLLVAVIIHIVRCRARRRKKEPEQAALQSAGDAAEVTVMPEEKPVVEAANLQGIGRRGEQQDAFGMSPLEKYEEQGILAVMCDGMGGMAEGGRIAAHTVSELLGLFPWENDEEVPERIDEISAGVYRSFMGRGGTTLVAARIYEGKLMFWCVGDSDLFLLREEKLYSMNIRQEYRNELMLRALDGIFPAEEAYEDPQAGALSEYIGKEHILCDHTIKPFGLQPGDVLLLCSDGVSDTLTLRNIREAMELTPEECCERIEELILKADVPNQDNYTAVVLKYNGKKERKDNAEK